MWICVVCVMCSCVCNNDSNLNFMISITTIWRSSLLPIYYPWLGLILVLHHQPLWYWPRNCNCNGHQGKNHPLNCLCIARVDFIRSGKRNTKNIVQMLISQYGTHKNWTLVSDYWLFLRKNSNSHHSALSCISCSVLNLRLATRSKLLSRAFAMSLINKVCSSHWHHV